MRKKEDVVVPLAEKSPGPGDWKDADAAFQSNRMNQPPPVFFWRGVGPLALLVLEGRLLLAPAFFERLELEAFFALVAMTFS
ncbi:MAG TPA: hypothetical protein VFR86_08010 [Burkholderiaceae bacterium]|nr:hypothetical protein [Burkholderiaceae bacterium]